MVAQQIRSKNSSTRRKGGRNGYEFPSVIETDWQLPKDLEVKPFAGKRRYMGTDGYSIFGRLEGRPVNPAKWKEPPHRTFVNLPCKPTSVPEMEMIDPNAMLGFIRRCGFLYAISQSDDPRMARGMSRLGYSDHLNGADDRLMPVEGSRNLQSISELALGLSLKSLLEDPTVPLSQALLKFVWQSNDRQILADFAQHASRGLASYCDFETGEIITTIKSVWALVCLLIVRDRAAGRTAVCANPECPAPYFLKSRKTQKICEAGECVAWAQRNYARKWWRENESKAAKGVAK